jgi:hypothetical protein
MHGLALPKQFKNIDDVHYPVIVSHMGLLEKVILRKRQKSIQKDQ